jgi:hypothetical protein
MENNVTTRVNVFNQTVSVFNAETNVREEIPNFGLSFSISGAIRPDDDGLADELRAETERFISTLDSLKRLEDLNVLLSNVNRELRAAGE